MSQEKNIYIELPEDVREEVSKEAGRILSKIMETANRYKTIPEVKQFLKQELFKSMTSHQADLWFKDKEIASLNEIIQTKVAKEVGK